MTTNTSKHHEDGKHFSSSELECGQLEIKQEGLSLSKRLSYVSLGLNIRCQKLHVKLKETVKKYFTTKVVEVALLTLTSIILFSILFHKLSQNNTLIRGKFSFTQLFWIEFLKRTWLI